MIIINDIIKVIIIAIITIVEHLTYDSVLIT